MKKGKKTKLQPWYGQSNPSTPNPHKHEYLFEGWQKIWGLQQTSHSPSSWFWAGEKGCVTWQQVFAFINLFRKPELWVCLFLLLSAALAVARWSQRAVSLTPDSILTMLQEFAVRQSDIPGIHTAGIIIAQRLFSSRYTESCQQTETSPVSFISMLFCIKKIKRPFHLNLGLFSHYIAYLKKCSNFCSTGNRFSRHLVYLFHLSGCLNDQNDHVWGEASQRRTNYLF